MLIKGNIYHYIDIKLDYNFIEENKNNHDIAYYDTDAKVCKKLKNIIKHTKEYNKDYSRFGLYCLSKFVSYNEATKLFKQKYTLDFSKVETYKGYDNTLYYTFKNLTWSDNIEFKDIVNKFIIYKLKVYSYSDDSLDVNFNDSLLKFDDYQPNNYFSENNKEILGPNLYMVIKWWIKQGKLTIIDKGNYFMFFFNNQKKFHLCRTEDNDVYFREKDFDHAIKIIFEKLL